MIRILITDDHEIIRKSLKHILEEEFKNIEFGEAASGEEALEKARNETWDVIVMDMTMPGLSGFATLKQMRKETIETPVLVMSFNANDGYAARIIKAGASGFISKDNAFQDLIVAIHFILLNKKVSATKKPVDLINSPLEKAANNWIVPYENLVLNILFTVKNIFKNVI